MLHPVLLFVPLDDRPVTGEAVAELAAAAGAKVRMPDRALLGDRDRPGEAAEIRRWLAGAVAAGADALIASVEMLCFGGLVAARKSAAEFAEVMPALGQVLELAAQLPAYLSAVVPRTPVVATDEDPAYWAAYGEALRAAPGALDLPAEGAPGDALEAALA
ncbi:MAG TPA: DUF4127 family protein, partial [bacterium]|nr:DUF4127 family protein [bacterium]